jgi:hypothetical protein
VAVTSSLEGSQEDEACSSGFLVSVTDLLAVAIRVATTWRCMLYIGNAGLELGSRDQSKVARIDACGKVGDCVWRRAFNGAAQ